MKGSWPHPVVSHSQRTLTACANPGGSIVRVSGALAVLAASLASLKIMLHAPVLSWLEERNLAQICVRIKNTRVWNMWSVTVIYLYLYILSVLLDRYRSHHWLCFHCFHYCPQIWYLHYWAGLLWGPHDNILVTKKRRRRLGWGLDWYANMCSIRRAINVPCV